MNYRAFRVARVHGLVALRAGENIALAAIGDLLYRARKPRRVTGAQRVGIESLVVADASGFLASVSQINRD